MYNKEKYFFFNFTQFFVKKGTGKFFIRFSDLFFLVMLNSGQRLQLLIIEKGIMLKEGGFLNTEAKIMIDKSLDLL